ncbi:ribonuclease HII Family 2 ['Chrysanthemum coronarium' phytoplasma]|uniref:Ribonuclease n=3 Tax=16SrI (Aster yellows group) TaxID=3042590 RepID=Q6YPU4_ONYPE|nr:ribonuclease HII Family 2 [Onion yellows phytoplasma OY-M]GAK73785.1 ribonuclease HII Family 2 ['Chrysanthemum coronarium' phytoplasma]
MMSNYSFKLNNNQVATIKKFYYKQLKLSPNKTVAFVIDESLAKIIVYNNGTLLVQGKNTLSIVAFIKKILQMKTVSDNSEIKEVSHSLVKQVPTLKTKSNAGTNSFLPLYNKKTYYLPSIGSDEVGTGDVFGPVIVCCVYLTAKNIVFLQKLGTIAESKKISDEKIMQLAPLIMKEVIYSVKIMMPLEYNQTIKQCNLNKIKALMHNEAIKQTVLKASPNVPVILDQFCFPKNYFNYLQDQKAQNEIYTKIIFETKADSSYFSVAVASVIARYLFLTQIAKLSKQINSKLQLGAGKLVDLQIDLIVKQHGLEILPQIAKCNFKNIVRKME